MNGEMKTSMILSKQNGQYWREKVVARIARWLTHAFPVAMQKQQVAPQSVLIEDQSHHPAIWPPKAADEVADSINATGEHASFQPEGSGAIAQQNHSELRTGKQDIPLSPITPLEWFKGLPRDMSLVIYIDQTTTQIMEMLAVSRRQAADLFQVPMYAGAGTRWQTLGAHRMRRMDFAPALAFQEQEAALGELEGLLSARWYASTELSKLDQSILRAFEASCMPDGAPVIGLPVAPDAITQLRQLLQSRAVMSEEANRIDGELITAFQKIGVALPNPSPPVG